MTRPKRAREWLALLEGIMATVYSNSFRVPSQETEEETTDETGEGGEGELFATSRGIDREPFVKELLINSGVLTPLGRLDKHFVEDPEGCDPLRYLGRPEIYKAAMDHFYPEVGGKKPTKRADHKLLQRMLYLVDEDLFDKLRHWELWSRSDGAEYVSTLTIKRCRKAMRHLQLTNPSQEPDHEWDTPD